MDGQASFLLETKRKQQKRTIPEVLEKEWDPQFHFWSFPVYPATSCDHPYW